MSRATRARSRVSGTLYLIYFLEPFAVHSPCFLHNQTNGSELKVLKDILNVGSLLSKSFGKKYLHLKCFIFKYLADLSIHKLFNFKFLRPNTRGVHIFDGANLHRR